MSHSSVAQWQSNRLLTDRSLVRIQPGELNLKYSKTSFAIYCMRGFFVY